MQKIGNRFRVTIPKDMAEMLSLQNGDTVSIMAASDNDRSKIMIGKIEGGAPTMAKFYDALKVKEIKKWPSSQEIKSILE
ncbi:MAG TPA: AbrB/MazE/SpoVT family DNA-binding domain-containing protein [Nitrososphaera sp.]|nr:AbrB/MazE/SpoVT family DNA-binding domain-containing protein [Nitrososphaera sp.]